MDSCSPEHSCEGNADVGCEMCAVSTSERGGVQGVLVRVSRCNAAATAAKSSTYTRSTCTHRYPGTQSSAAGCQSVSLRYRRPVWEETHIPVAKSESETAGRGGCVVAVVAAVVAVVGLGREARLGLGGTYQYDIGASGSRLRSPL